MITIDYIRINYIRNYIVQSSLPWSGTFIFIILVRQEEEIMAV